MSYSFYSFFHIVAVVSAAISLAMILSHTIQGGTKENLKIRKPIAILHGVSLTIALVAGFGLIAKGGFSFEQKWIYVKLACWFLLGAFPVLLYKNILPKWSGLVGLLVILTTAVMAVVYKPF